MFTIEANIPMPAKKQVGQIDKLVTRMSVGDSVLTPYKANGATSVFTLAARRQGMKEASFNARSIGDGQTRVWRVA